MPPEEGPFGAVILAAGRSVRQRGFKPLLTLGGRTVLERCLEPFQGLEAGPCRTVVVLGHRAEALQPLVSASGATPVINPDPDRGMFASVQAGAAALDPSVRVFFVHPADIPLVRSVTLSALLRVASEHPGAQAFIPAFAGQTGHPPLLRTGMRRVIAGHDGTRGLRGVLDKVETLEVSVPDCHILVDMDTPGQYDLAQRLWQRRDILAPEEAEVLLDLECGRSSQVAAHSRCVARVAETLAHAVNALAGNRLDIELVRAAALLHDIAKGRPDYCAAAAARLTGLGFSSRLTAIVAGHGDHDPEPRSPVDETEIVSLADSLVQGTRVVSVQERFQAKLEASAGNPEALRAAERRRRQAKAVEDRVARACGGRLPDTLQAGEHRSG